jgi:uncharacterized protein YdaU (DUF1376 family)
MSKQPEKVDAWMPLWIGSYLADTMDLDRHEHGGYLLLLIAYWRNKGPLLDDDKKLANITKCKTRPEWRDLRSTLAPFFDVREGLWTHGRADEELAKAGKNKAAAVSKATKGAEARWGKDRKHPESDAPSIAPGTAPGNAEGLPKHCPTPSPTPDPSDHSDPDGSGAAGADADLPPAPPPPQKPKLTPDEIIFGYGVPLLTAAGNSDKHARSFLAGLRKAHGDSALVNGLRECIKAKPLQPLEWLAKALPPPSAGGGQSALEARNAAAIAAALEEEHAAE